MELEINTKYGKHTIFFSSEDSKLFEKGLCVKYTRQKMYLCKKTYLGKDITTNKYIYKDDQIARLVLSAPKDEAVFYLNKNTFDLRRENLATKVKKLDITGKQFNSLKVLKSARFLPTHGQYWQVECVCGKRKEVLQTHIVSGATKSCGCIMRGDTNKYWSGCGAVSGNYLGSLKRNAASRGIEFNITCEDIWNKFENQQFKCNLSGLELVFGALKKSAVNSTTERQTASVDRIDSTKGYTKDNIQIVHKYLNVMKLNHTQEEFIRFCTLVAEHNKNKV